MNRTGAFRGVLVAATTALAVAGALAPATGAVAASSSAVGPGRVIVVDDDKVECPDADFTVLQAALDAADDGDRVRVCAGLYRESLTVDTSVTVQGEVGAVASVDCLDPASSDAELDTTRFAVVRPPAGPQADGALVRIAADDVEVAGLVVEGRLDTVIEEPVPGATLYDAAVSVSDAYVGTRLRHNLFRLNTLGVELGASDSRVDHNCFRDNRWALANQRYVLKRARIHDNTTTGTEFITWEVGWSYRGTEDVLLDHNVSDETSFYVARVDNSKRARVVANDIRATQQGIRVNPANEGVQVVGNTVTGLGPGLGVAGVFVPVLGGRPATTGLVIADNEVFAMDANPGRGIILMPGSQPTGAVITGNRLHDNATEGLALTAGNHASTISGNVVTGNLANGIRVAAGAGLNVLTDNVALDNNTEETGPGTGTGTDARDGGLLADGVTPTSNQWIRTTCEVDVPVGLICVPPTTGTDGSAGP